MPDPHDPIDAAIIAHLATRDTPCPTCSYNLRGLTTLQCPECARPITATDARLPDESNTDRLVRHLRNRNLKCKCGHNLRDNPDNECPKCHRTYQLMGGRHLIARKRRSFFARLILTIIFLAIVLTITFVLALLIEALNEAPNTTQAQAPSP